MEIYASSDRPHPFYALITAGGSGSRLGGTVPKQYLSMGGKPILRRTIEAFLACSDLRELRVVIDPAHRELYENAVLGLDLPPPVAGGSERNISIFNGIKSFSNLKYEDIILLHDAARPMIGSFAIHDVVTAVLNHDAATLAVPVTDTIKYENGLYADRKGLWAIQTPQGFRYGLIKTAHEQASPDAAPTDDTVLVAAMGHEIAFVPGSRSNIKITTAEDLVIAEKLLGAAETRTGSGFDVHAFTDGNHVRLCGIDIPHRHALAGHSDADVMLHALTDALLGAIGAGDIGQHFPPSDPQWKGCDSGVFVQEAIRLVAARGGKIVNIDLTLICETPKIGPYRDAMRQRTAKLCGIGAERVNIKATTTERLGFTGRNEGIAAQAIANVSFPLVAGLE